MKYDPKALEAMIDSFNFGASPEQILDVYCEKAGVVMVPREPTWGIEAMSGAGAEQIPAEVGRGEAGDMACNVYCAMIRASQEEE